MKLRKLLVASIAASLFVGTANAGVFILDGTDSDDHGSVSGTTNNNGWFYIQSALQNIASSASLTRTQTVIAVLGASAGDAQNAVTSAVNNGTLSGTHTLLFLNDAQISGFFANTNAAGSNSTDARILYIPSDDVSGGISASEETLLTANAALIDGFLGSGGGLFSQGHSYGWLGALITGATVVSGGGDTSALTLTAAGNANFPGLTNAQLSTGPWHYDFANFGAIPVLATGVRSGRSVPVIIGGSGGSITQPPSTGAVPEPGTWAMMLLGFGFVGGTMRYSRRKQRIVFAQA